MSKDIKKPLVDVKAAYKERKGKFEKSMDTWTPKELEEHKRRVESFYKTGTASVNLLGDFSNDPTNVYYWHTVDKNHENKLKRRRDLGWAVASRADIENAEISVSSKYGDIRGETAVIANHGDVKAILLKIPRDLYNFNREMKRNISNKQTGLDIKGDRVAIKEKLEAERIVRHRDEGMISIEDINK